MIFDKATPERRRKLVLRLANVAELPVPLQKKILNTVYDRLYKLADKYSKTNYCKSDGKTCLSDRQNTNSGFGDTGGPFCCKGCKYLGPQGCTIDALTCRSWFCGAFTLPKPIRTKLENLSWQVWQWGFYVNRGTKEQSIENALFKLHRIRVRKAQENKMLDVLE